MRKLITENSKETQKLGELLAEELRGGEVICLEGDLGAGKTTFAQGLLKGLGAKGPYTSPTFVVMKEYKINKLKAESRKLKAVYHIDAYRVGPDDLLALSWKEITANKENVVIVEWADRIKKILPKNCLKINFRWLDEKKREIKFS